MCRLLSYIAAVVDETGEVATLRSIYDGVVINAEHVAAADALLLVTLLPHVRDHLIMKIVNCWMFDSFKIKLKPTSEIETENHGVSNPISETIWFSVPCQ